MVADGPSSAHPWDTRDDARVRMRPPRRRKLLYSVNDEITNRYTESKPKVLTYEAAGPQDADYK